MTEAERLAMIRKLDSCTGDSEMDEKTTDELYELIMRARFALKRRAANARQALMALDEPRALVGDAP